ncbi:hypothetical protein BDZ97DRAFT_1758818 [Flammula alnicola]|nr:hypothetical protein BDZ97DRAFT_1758818 [Flammula alnicola]
MVFETQKISPLQRLRELVRRDPLPEYASDDTIDPGEAVVQLLTKCTTSVHSRDFSLPSRTESESSLSSSWNNHADELKPMVIARTVKSDSNRLPTSTNYDSHRLLNSNSQLDLASSSAYSEEWCQVGRDNSDLWQPDEPSVCVPSSIYPSYKPLMLERDLLEVTHISTREVVTQHDLVHLLSYWRRTLVCAEFKIKCGDQHLLKVVATFECLKLKHLKLTSSESNISLDLLWGIVTAPNLETLQITLKGVEGGFPVPQVPPFLRSEKPMVLKVYRMLQPRGRYISTLTWKDRG